jgi:hypothetical protein
MFPAAKKHGNESIFTIALDPDQRKSKLGAVMRILYTKQIISLYLVSMLSINVRCRPRKTGVQSLGKNEHYHGAVSVLNGWLVAK